MTNILHYDDLIKISNALTESGYGPETEMEITIPIRTQQYMNRINDDFAFKLGINEEEKSKDPQEIKISIGGFTYRYYLNELDDSNL